jgi:hypothetical protein
MDISILSTEAFKEQIVITANSMPLPQVQGLYQFSEKQNAVSLLIRFNSAVMNKLILEDSYGVLILAKRTDLLNIYLFVFFLKTDLIYLQKSDSNHEINNHSLGRH